MKYLTILTLVTLFYHCAYATPGKAGRRISQKDWLEDPWTEEVKATYPEAVECPPIDDEYPAHRFYKRDLQAVYMHARLARHAWAYPKPWREHPFERYRDKKVYAYPIRTDGIIYEHQNKKNIEPGPYRFIFHLISAEFVGLAYHVTSEDPLKIGWCHAVDHRLPSPPPDHSAPYQNTRSKNPGIERLSGTSPSKSGYLPRRKGKGGKLRGVGSAEMRSWE